MGEAGIISLRLQKEIVYLTLFVKKSEQVRASKVPKTEILHNKSNQLVLRALESKFDSLYVRKGRMYCSRLSA